jgi:hypothetical protein
VFNIGLCQYITTVLLCVIYDPRMFPPDRRHAQRSAKHLGPFVRFSPDNLYVLMPKLPAPIKNATRYTTPILSPFCVSLASPQFPRLHETSPDRTAKPNSGPLGPFMITCYVPPSFPCDANAKYQPLPLYLTTRLPRAMNLYMRTCTRNATGKKCGVPVLVCILPHAGSRDLALLCLYSWIWFDFHFELARGLLPLFM